MPGFETLSFDVIDRSAKPFRSDRSFSVFGDDFGSSVSFDRQPEEKPSLEAIPVERMFSQAELNAAIEKARAEGNQVGREEGLAAGKGSAEQAVALAMTRISTLMPGATQAVHQSVTEVSDDLAKMLFAALRAMLPELMQRYGAEEIAAMARAIVPRVADGIQPRVLVNVALAADVERHLTLPGASAPMVEVVPSEAIALGDATIAWKSGSAKLSCEDLWADIVLALAPLGLGDNNAGDKNVG